MKKQLLLAACAVIIGTAPASQADAVLDWNAIAAQTIFAAGHEHREVGREQLECGRLGDEWLGECAGGVGE